MSTLLKVSTSEQDSVLVEVVSPEEEGLVEVGAERMIQEATVGFDSVLEVAEKCAVEFVNGLRIIKEKTGVDEVSLEFGVSLQVDIGAIIAKAASEGSFQVTLTWKSRETAAH